MFRQLKVPILGMIENMSFFDMAAYLAERGGSKARDLIRDNALFDPPGDERVYLFGRGGAKRRAEEMGVPFLGEVPLNIVLRESGDEGKLDRSLAEGSPAWPYFRDVVEQVAAQISIQNIKTPKMHKLETLS